jgi:hypothetical protein
VQRSLGTDGTFNPPKRNKSRRTVKLTGQAIEALKSHRVRQNEERLRLGSLWEDHNPVFEIKFRVQLKEKHLGPSTGV